MEKDILSKITQGDWKVGKNACQSYDIYRDEAWIANVYHGYGVKKGEVEHNALLIVKAPETLKQRDDLLDLVKRYKILMTGVVREECDKNCTVDNCDLTKEIKAIDKAIAEAEDSK